MSNEELRFALIGERIDYSRSPQIFEAIFEQLHLVGRFELHSVEPQQLEARLRDLVADGIAGLSVSIPYKQKVVPYLNEIGPVARELDAVNSIVVDNNRLRGYNTDCHGFSVPLQAYADRLRDSRAVVVGSGGAARAVIYALVNDFGVTRITVAGRSIDNVVRFKQQLEDRLAGLEITPVSLDSDLNTTISGAALLVNCTPVGGANQPSVSPFPKSFDFTRVSIYYDLNYNRDNRLIRAAREAGIITIDGSSMLVAQAIRSFRLWTGRTIEFQPVYDAVFSAG